MQQQSGNSFNRLRYRWQTLFWSAYKGRCGSYYRDRTALRCCSSVRRTDCHQAHKTPFRYGSKNSRYAGWQYWRSWRQRKIWWDSWKMRYSASAGPHSNDNWRSCCCCWGSRISCTYETFIRTWRSEYDYRTFRKGYRWIHGYHHKNNDWKSCSYW